MLNAAGNMTGFTYDFINPVKDGLRNAETKMLPGISLNGASSKNQSAVQFENFAIKEIVFDCG